MRIAFASQGVVGPSDGVADPRNPMTYSRFYLPGLALQAAGHEACMVPDLLQRSNGELVGSFEWPTGMLDPTYHACSPWLRPLARRPGRRRSGKLFEDIDVVVVMAWATRDAPERVRRARAAGQVVIVDLLDWMWSHDQPESPYSDNYSACNPDRNRDHLREVVKAASAVTVTTPYIAGRLRQWGWNANVFVLRNMVDAALWKPGRRRSENAGRRPRVGWYGETWLRHDDLRTLNGVLGPFLQHYDLVFVHVGDFPCARQAWELLGVDLERSGGIFNQAPIEQLPGVIRMAGIDVGLVPMAGNEFNAGKSCLKGMEWASAGIPFVAQWHSEYEHFGAGLLASTPDDWWLALQRLIDPQERARIAADGLVRAAQQDWRVRGHEWIDVFESLVAARVPVAGPHG